MKLLATQTDDLPERQAMQKLTPVYEKRRAVAKSIDKFWPVALMNNGGFSFHAQHNIDQIALSYLEDLWIARDPKEPRCYTIEFVRCC
jgi:template-activating factor I